MFIRILCSFFILANSLFAEYQKVVVIGAGLAGLTTAHRLQQLTGQPVEVYEARERPGGRILTAHFYDSYEELGAKFLCVTEAVRLKALIREMGLEIETTMRTVSDRKYVYQGKVAPYYSPFLNTPASDQSTYDQLKEAAAEGKNLGAIMDAFFAKQPIPRHLAEIRMRGLEGKDTKELSTAYVDNFWDYYNRCSLIAHGEDHFHIHQESIKGGNSLLPENLTKRMKDHVHFGQPLRKISLTHDRKYLLEFPNNKTVTADYLVLAIPCSTLRDVQIEKGIIPADQWKAIKALQYGTNGHILLGVKLGNDSSEYSVTEDALVWFNSDRKILTLAYGGKPGVFDSHSSEGVNKRIHEEMAALKLLFPSITYSGRKRAVSWAMEEFSKGSNSSWGPDQFDLYNEKMEMMGETVRKVFRPVQNRLFFAGEHAAIDHPATMEGAVESGESTARMVAQIVSPPAKEKETTGPGS
jgi:monoamine oxidase